jgi:hypothetical protein
LLNLTILLRKMKSAYESTSLLPTWAFFCMCRVVNGMFILKELTVRSSMWIYFMFCFYLLNILWFLKLTKYTCTKLMFSQ